MKYSNRLIPVCCLMLLGGSRLLAQVDPVPSPNDPGVAATLSKPGDPGTKDYTNVAVPGGYTEEKPAYCYFKKLSIKRISDRRLEFTAEMQGEIPSRDTRKFWMLFYLDVDKNGSTGTSTAGGSLKDFGWDTRFWIRRTPGTPGFDGWSEILKVGGKPEEIEVRKIETKGNTITFVAQSPLFLKYQSFRFYGVTSLEAYDGRDKNDISSTSFISFVPKSGAADF